jgi:hypothetical protein
VVEADAVFVEAIVLHRLVRKRMRPDAEADRAVAQERTGVEVHQLVEAEDFGVEPDRAVYVAYGEPKVVDTLGRDLI